MWKDHRDPYLCSHCYKKLSTLIFHVGYNRDHFKMSRAPTRVSKLAIQHKPLELPETGAKIDFLPSSDRKSRGLNFQDHIHFHHKLFNFPICLADDQRIDPRSETRATKHNPSSYWDKGHVLATVAVRDQHMPYIERSEPLRFGLHHLPGDTMHKVTYQPPVIL